MRFATIAITAVAGVVVGAPNVFAGSPQPAASSTAVGATVTPAATTEPATETPVEASLPTAAASATATGAPPPPATPALPDRDISLNGSVRGVVLQDDDASGGPSAGDSPVKTLAQLLVYTRFTGEGSEPGVQTEDYARLSDRAAMVSLFTDDQGRFSFDNIPEGEHVLLVWSYGFLGPRTSPTNEGLFRANIVVEADGRVHGPLPEVLLARVKPEGVLGYPVSAGGEAPTAVGRIDVAAFLRGTGAAPALPSAGGDTANTGSPAAWYWIAPSAIAVMLGLGAAITLRRRAG